MSGLIADTGEHRLIRQSAATIAARYGHAYYAERARAGGNIAELWEELGQAGLLGVHLPAEYGGGGAGLSELVIVTEELAAHGMPLLIAVISPAICGSILAAHASPDMKASWLPGLADGTRKMAFALPSRTPARTATTSAPPRGGPTRAGSSDDWPPQRAVAGFDLPVTPRSRTCGMWATGSRSTPTAARPPAPRPLSWSRSRWRSAIRPAPRPDQAERYLADAAA